ncbi:MASE3 domain-containing protein [Paludibacterium denitrificans]|uniref:PAS domain S-box protein n=1 Tax=Paludibacterium denitrificans TaxID=2675226 RepID=A0A844GCL3_9NEIS|nr:MASE3 domain-containing protein [Paludibacterium denitrificans]MTD32345.1 PAS domain S-box protein [Paludibacterium denitrificans]
MSHHSIFTSLANQREATAFSWQSALWVSLPPLLLSAVCVLGTSISYLLFHTLAELISIIIALTALVVATTSRRFTRNHFVVFIAVVIGWCAALDPAHTLVFKGMGLTLNNSANPATQIWIAARAIQAVALLFAPLFLRRSVRVGWLHLVMGGITLGVGGLIAAGHFPTAYIDGQGLTPFKITSEYVIVALLGVTLWRLWRDRKLMAPTLAYHLAAAVVAMILSELAFTHYVSVYSNANLIGHLFKIFAYWFIYIALVHNTLREPFTMLARAASTYDAVPEPTIVVQTDGTIREANQASEDYTGLQLEQLIGQSSHTLFHDASIPAEHCPVCLRIAQGTATFTQELVQEKGFWAVECSVAPFSGNDPEHAYVRVIRDISQRRQLEAERETLVYNLGERIKELRCLYAISDLIEKPDIDIPSLLKGVIDVLPSAFRFPEQAQAGLVSQWGQFGMAFGDCHNDNTRQLQRPLEVNGATVGTVWVCYPEAIPLDDAPFLAEEQELMDTVALRVSETIENNLAAARLQRLTNFYEMLSATNRAIVHCRSIEQLLVALFEALSAHSTFPMLFIARTNNGQLPFYPVHAYGINDTHLQTLTRTLADPASLIGQILPQLQTGNIVCTAVPPASDDNASEWITYLHAQGITERAIMPLLREGELLGIVGLYATRADAFDQDQLRLLGEMATDMSFALYSPVAEQRRIAAEELATLSEHRFREVFESSPLPMQIHSVTTGTIHAINRAHTKWLGYTTADISNENDWFEHVFVDPDIREQIRQLWQQDLRLAQSSSLIARSPELTLRCKDGSNRIAHGTMTVVGNDAVLAWTDLTDIRHGELALRESEQRFRSMIEQTVSGIYVRRDGSYIYVNPRYCEMTGWAAEDLLGKNVLEFTVQDPAVLQSIHAAPGPAGRRGTQHCLFRAVPAQGRRTAGAGPASGHHQLGQQPGHHRHGAGHYRAQAYRTADRQLRETAGRLNESHPAGRIQHGRPA